MRNRNNVLVALGIAFFVIGAALVFLLSGGDDGGSSSNNAAATATDPLTPVLVAKENIADGLRGDDLIAEDKIEVKQLPKSQVVDGSLNRLAQLNGATFTTPFGKGEQILAAGVRQDPLAAGGIIIPEGLEAVAVSIGPIPGGAGYVSPGARINLYGLIDKPESVTDFLGNPVPLGYDTPRVELILTNVEVLDVNTVVPALAGQEAVAARGAVPTLTYLLALAPEDVERMLVLDQFNSMWVSILRQDAGDTPDTPGRSPFDLLNDTPSSGAAPAPSSADGGATTEPSAAAPEDAQ